MTTPIILFEIRENESVMKHLMPAKPTLMFAAVPRPPPGM
jgi:hypothetical protein